MKIRDLVDKRQSSFFTIDSHRSVHEAIESLQKNNARVLIVTEQKRPVGIFAERDVLRAYLRNRSTTFDRIVLKEVMTPKLITANAEDKIASTMDMMLKADIHHLPVIADDDIVSVLTLYDLVQYRVESLEKELHDLKDVNGLT